MTITQLDVIGRAIPLADDFPVSYGDHVATEHAFVEEWLTPRIEGQSVDRAQRALAAFADEFPGNPGGTAAVEMALLDLAGKRAEIPVRDLLGVTRRETIPCVYPVPGLEPDRAREVTDEGLERGFQRFKIKATGDVERDVARIDAVLERLPEGATARVDANTGWETYPRARRAIDAIADPEKIEYFEQPVAADRPEDLRRLWYETSIPVYADEFVHGPADVERLGREGLARGCHLKLAKTGSLRRMAHMATTAGQYGLNAVAVSAFGTSLEATAICHLAAVIPSIPLACELDPSLIAEDPTGDTLYVEPNTPVPEGPGIGVDLDDDLFE